MSSRKKLRKEREAQERKEAEKRKRIRGLLAFAAVIALSVAFVVGAILLQLDRQDDNRSGAKIEKLLGNIPQNGLRLGNPDAETVLLEWGDMQCAACASFANKELPDIIEKKVRPGKIQIEFRQWPILGPDSNLAARAALAASLQNRYWYYIEYYYARKEAGQTPDDDFLEEVARAAGVPDIERWRKDMELPRWEKEMLQNDETAIEYQFSGTPSFAIQRGSKITPLQLSSPGDLIDQLGK